MRKYLKLTISLIRKFNIINLIVRPNAEEQQGKVKKNKYYGAHARLRSKSEVNTR